MQPLQGLRIVNLAVNLPGPAAAQRLSRMGAVVVKVEPPSGDPMELYHAQWYRDMARGHLVHRLDIKSAEGREHLDRFLEKADLLITASRSSALERLELDWAHLHAQFPRLCHVAIVGYPAPRNNEAGHDLTYQASLGLVSPPHLPRTLLADMAGAERAVGDALALILARERGGSAGFAEIPLSEAVAAMAEPLRYGCTEAGALLGGGVPEYNIYETATGWIAVAALEPHFKKRLEEALGVGTPAEYRAAFAGRTAAQWQEWGQKLDIPIVAIA